METAIDGCGAVCAGAGSVYTASEKDGVIYRLDEKLLPCGVYAGGPGMSALRITKDGERLFALLSDADSVLMLGGQDGLPMFLARVGVNPRQMRLQEGGRYLTIAGGRDGSATVLCAHTLKPLCSSTEEGVCCDAMLLDGCLYALRLTPALDTCLSRWDEQGKCRHLFLPGEPGSLCRRGNALLVSAGQWLYAIETAQMRLKKKRFLSGFPGRLISAGKTLLLLCPGDETLYRLDMHGKRKFCSMALDAACE